MLEVVHERLDLRGVRDGVDATRRRRPGRRSACRSTAGTVEYLIFVTSGWLVPGPTWSLEPLAGSLVIGSHEAAATSPLMFWSASSFLFCSPMIAQATAAPMMATTATQAPITTKRRRRSAFFWAACICGDALAAVSARLAGHRSSFLSVVGGGRWGRWAVAGVSRSSTDGSSRAATVPSVGEDVVVPEAADPPVAQRPRDRRCVPSSASSAGARVTRPHASDATAR